MKQVVQPLSGGGVRVVEVPAPTIGPAEVLVRTLASVISPGTEGALAALSRAGLIGKARARPDLVRQVIDRARRDGIVSTARAVRRRLDEDTPLGYSAAGIAEEVGEAVAGVRPGQLVATAGAGKANHAEFQAVPGLLCAVVPEGVTPEDAAFATIAAIALNGLRQADLGPGSRVVVIGLGLLGQLTSRLALAAGCEVAGVDLAESPIERARANGVFALQEAGDDTTTAVLDWTDGAGADAVFLTAATPSSDAAMRAPALCRDRAAVVVVGDVGLELARAPFYEKELSIRFARSYGPGRYDPSYEEWGVDYPDGFVRWTEGRNLAAALGLMASGRLVVSDLVTHRFPIDQAPEAYELIAAKREPYLGIALRYAETLDAKAPIALRAPATERKSGVALIGAGGFATAVLMPAFREAGFERFVAVASASGLSAARAGERLGFERAVSGADAAVDDPEVGVVVIATPHDSHAALAAQALRAGKHVFCEKPLALTMEELQEVEDAVAAGGGVLWVGFNRRSSEAVAVVRDHFARAGGPLVVNYRVNTEHLAPDHWYNDRRQGGRLLGEVCHFVDTCAAIVGAPAGSVQAFASDSGERLLAGDFVLALSYPDGSVATISYASAGHPSVEKERVEVLGRGHSALIVDYNSVMLDGRSASLHRADKGHVAHVRAFRDAIAAGTFVPEPFLSSTRTTLLAAESTGRLP